MLMEKSDEDIMGFIVGGIYVALMVVAIWRLIVLFIFGRNTNQPFLARKLFYFVTIPFLGLRSTFLLTNAVLGQGELSVSVAIIWLHSARFLFCTTWFILLMFWINFYYLMYENRNDFFQTVSTELIIVVSANGTFFLFLILLLGFECGVQYSCSHCLIWMNESILVLNTSLSLQIGIAFLVYGALFFRMIRQSSLQVFFQKAKLMNYQLAIMGFAAVGFLVGVGLGLWGTHNIIAQCKGKNPKDFSKLNGFWSYVIFQFLISEILPVACMIALYF